MKQRVAIAISTILSPKLIIADEPTSALDVVVQRQVMMTLAHVQEELGAATILIGHDMGLIAQFSDSIGVLYAGKLVERGDIDSVLESPRHPYTRLLTASLPELGERKDFIGIPGLPPALFDRPPGCRFHPRCPYAFDRCRTEEPQIQTINGVQAACHLYPEHTELPPLPEELVAIGANVPAGGSKGTATNDATNGVVAQATEVQS